MKPPPTPRARTHTRHFTTMNWRGTKEREWAAVHKHTRKHTHTRFLFATMKVNWIFNSSKIIIFEVEKLQFISKPVTYRVTHISEILSERACARAPQQQRWGTCWHLNVSSSSFSLMLFLFQSFSLLFSLSLSHLHSYPFAFLSLHRSNSFALCVFFLLVHETFHHCLCKIVWYWILLWTNIYTMYWMLLIYIL